MEPDATRRGGRCRSAALRTQAASVGGSWHLDRSRLARRLAPRYGQHRVILVAGTLRACWLIGLIFVRPGAAGIVLVIAVQFGLVVSCGVFNPVLATYRLEQTRTDRVARTLSAWSVSTSATIAALTFLGGLLASVTSLRTAMAASGLLILATPLLLPRHERKQQPEASPEHYLAATALAASQRG